MCEAFNRVILDVWSKSTITMLLNVRQNVMTMIIVKKNYTKKFRGDYGPNILAKIEKERKKGAKRQVKWNESACHKVYYNNSVLYIREGYVVMLKIRANQIYLGKTRYSSPAYAMLKAIAS